MSSIAAVEKKTHEDINDRLEHLADKAFKSLRRALPVTRQKIEWQAMCVLVPYLGERDLHATR